MIRSGSKQFLSNFSQLRVTLILDPTKLENFWLIFYPTLELKSNFKPSIISAAKQACSVLNNLSKEEYEI